MNAGTPEMQRFYAPGKLMLTGEYLVLKGAGSISIPLNRGQRLEVSTANGPSVLEWTAKVEGKHWFEAKYIIPDLAIGNTADFSKAQNLRSILMASRKLNPSFLTHSSLIKAASDIDFNIDWGFGSSSSLLVNIARWASVDPLELHFRVSEGSGYDVAVATAEAPILYRLINGKPDIKRVDFAADFRDSIFFAYLGKKRNSSQAVSEFLKNYQLKDKHMLELDKINDGVLNSTSIAEFSAFIKRHEALLSEVLKLQPIARRHFDDFDGAVKSLGAWGGDFALFVSEKPHAYVKNYLNQKRLPVWFMYRQLIPDFNKEV
jgi:mevalonate kinase